MKDPINEPREYRNDARRKMFSSSFSVTCLLVSSLAIVVLATLLLSIFSTGGGWLSAEMLTASHRENNPEESGIGQAIIGSLVICTICGLAALPIGVGTAIFLEEFKPKNRFLRMLHGLVQLNINNLAGVPSIVYGILGLTAFVYMFGAFSPIRVNDQPDYEIGATYSYQTKTLGGNYVRFPATPKIQPVFFYYEVDNLGQQKVHSVLSHTRLTRVVHCFNLFWRDLFLGHLFTFCLAFLNY